MSLIEKNDANGSKLLQHIGEPDDAPAIFPARGSPISDAEINQTQG